MGRIKSTGALDLIAGGTLTSTSVGATTINSGAGAMNISTDASSNIISIGTGTVFKQINIGNSVNSTAVAISGPTITINSGFTATTTSISTDASAGSLSLGTGAAVKVVTIGSGTSTSSVTINTGTGALNLGTNATVHATTIGSTTGASATSMRSGSGGITLNGGAGGYTLSGTAGTLQSTLPSGSNTFPNQPAFLAYLPSAVANVTGNGGAYTLGSGTALTEVFDQQSNFNTNGTFTAPATGRYMLNASLRITGLTAAMTSGFFSIVTSNRTYLLGDINIGAVRDAAGAASFTGSTIVDMDAADTATVTLSVTGGAGNTAGVDGSASAFSFFGGSLIC